MSKTKLKTEILVKNADKNDYSLLGSLTKDEWKITTVKPGLYYSTVNLEKRI